MKNGDTNLIKEDYQRLKMLSYNAKITTHLKSNIKDEFFCDCIKRGKRESDLMREIIALHYEIIKRKGLSPSVEFCDLINILAK